MTSPLKAAREAAGLTQEQLAKMINTSQPQILRLESSKRKLTKEWAQRLAPALATTPEALIFGPAVVSTRLTDVPLIDSVTAGQLTSPSSQIPQEDISKIPFADLGPGEFFATRVAGTSMDRLSPDGSIIVVNRRDRELVPGRCYVFAIGGQTTYKRWQPARGDDPAYLEPYSTDPIHKPIFIHRKRDFGVIGRVKRTVLDL